MPRLRPFIRKWLSFVAFDESSIANGNVSALIQLIKAYADQPDNDDVPHNDSSLSKAFDVCLARFGASGTPAQDGSEGGFAWWRKSRARYACCVLLYACCGWLKSGTTKEHILLYAEVLECLLQDKLPRRNKGGNQEDTNITLDQYATLAGGYANEETESSLYVYDHVMEITDEQFMQITANEMLTIGNSDN